ncbi:MAG: hypothetical protein ACI399_07730 [Candidatus Cryptobacteroides sp.]
MKKSIFAISLILAASASAGAQTMYDALTFSRNDYYGTAKSIAMGNAMTAVGGDLGSIGINPAGSAVYSYSQVSITPNLTISSECGSFSAYPVNGSDNFINPRQTNHTRFSVPNFGATLHLNTGNRRGIKGVTLGVIFNGTNNYTSKMTAGGYNDKTSYLSSMAVDAFGFDSDFLNGNGTIGPDGSYNPFQKPDTGYPFTNPDDRGMYAPWNVVTNAQSGAISTFGDPDDPDYYWRYIAATEGYYDTGEVDKDGNRIYNIFLGGPLNQSYGRMVTGGKYEALVNAGININDKIYLGVNLGAVTMNYNYDEYFKEAANDPADFVIEYEDATTCFKDYRARYSYSADGEGVYAKIGFIALPLPGLRIGAAIQTPTWMNINEFWRNASEVNYTDQRFNGSAISPEGNFSYMLRSPYRVNAGVAYTALGRLLVSADYEMVDYRTMRFSNDDFNWNTDFSNVNADIRDCMGVSHTVRVGAEYKPVPGMAVRAGYNYSMTPEYSYATGLKSTIKDVVNSYSIGLGYSSKKSFFADIAARMTTFCDEYIYPYPDYLDDYLSPAILNRRERYNITATVGWRF